MHIDSSAIEVVQLRCLRTRILLLLQSVYPRQEHSDVIYLSLSEEKGIDTGLRDVLSEVAYLAEKKLIEVRQIFEHRFLVRITARGRDFVEGSIEEVGLESPSRF